MCSSAHRPFNKLVCHYNDGMSLTCVVDQLLYLIPFTNQGCFAFILPLEGLLKGFKEGQTLICSFRDELAQSRNSSRQSLYQLCYSK